MPQIKNPDDLRSIANLIRVFVYARQFPCYAGNSKRSRRPALRANLQKRHLTVSQSWALIEQEIRSAAFDKKVIRIEKYRTKSVDLRLPLFGISFNSSKKRDFFTSLFLPFRYLVFLPSSLIMSKKRLLSTS